MRDIYLRCLRQRVHFHYFPLKCRAILTLKRASGRASAFGSESRAVLPHTPIAADSYGRGGLSSLAINQRGHFVTT